jgi:hypothetical protein
MSGLCRICLSYLDLTLRKSRSTVKMINLGPDKLTACKQNTIKLREIKGTPRSKLITS